jgi:hypothetical protein
MADPADKASAATANGKSIFFIHSSHIARALIHPAFRNWFDPEIAALSEG